MLDKSSFWSGFFGAVVGIGIFCALGAASSQISNNFKSQQALFNEIWNINQTMQTRKFRVDIGSPSLASLGEHEVMILNSATTRALFTRLNSQLWKVNLSSN